MITASPFKCLMCLSIDAVPPLVRPNATHKLRVTFMRSLGRGCTCLYGSVDSNNAERESSIHYLLEANCFDLHCQHFRGRKLMHTLEKVAIGGRVARPNHCHRRLTTESSRRAARRHICTCKFDV